MDNDWERIDALIPMMRRTVPASIIEEIASVQPMTWDNSIFSFDFVYEDEPKTLTDLVKIWDSIKKS